MSAFVFTPDTASAYPSVSLSHLLSVFLSIFGLSASGSRREPIEAAVRVGEPSMSFAMLVWGVIKHAAAAAAAAAVVLASAGAVIEVAAGAVPGNPRVSSLLLRMAFER